MTGAIFCDTRPAITIKSDCRGEGRKTSAPKRARSNRDAPIDIISIAQQAKPNVMGQIELLRIQLTAESSVVSTTPSGVGLPKVGGGSHETILNHVTRRTLVGAYPYGFTTTFPNI